jgi:hypothetical protein
MTAMFSAFEQELKVRKSLNRYFILGKKRQMIIDESMQNAIAGGLAIAISIGAMLMMFSNVWTTKK